MRQPCGFFHFLATWDLCTSIFFQREHPVQTYVFRFRFSYFRIPLAEPAFLVVVIGKRVDHFLGISLFFFGISKLNTRWIYILIGALIVYHVRPHVMLIIVISSAIGFIFSSKGVSWGLRFLVLACSVLAFLFHSIAMY